MDEDFYKMPTLTKECIDNYVKLRIPTGGFLYAVLTNNLSEAIGRADENNMKCIVGIVRYIYNECPAACWGSEDRVMEWLKREKEVVDGNDTVAT